MTARSKRYCRRPLGVGVRRADAKAATVADQAAMAFENTKLSVAVQEGQEALQSRKLVERAKSLLQKQANLSEEEAYKRLQQQSMKTRRSMREIAEAVILSSELQS